MKKNKRVHFLNLKASIVWSAITATLIVVQMIFFAVCMTTGIKGIEGANIFLVTFLVFGSFILFFGASPLFFWEWRYWYYDDNEIGYGVLCFVKKLKYSEITTMYSGLVYVVENRTRKLKEKIFFTNGKKTISILKSDIKDEDTKKIESKIHMAKLTNKVDVLNKAVVCTKTEGIPFALLTLVVVIMGGIVFTIIPFIEGEKIMFIICTVLLSLSLIYLLYFIIYAAKYALTVNDDCVIHKTLFRTRSIKKSDVKIILKVKLPLKTKVIFFNKNVSDETLKELDSIYLTERQRAKIIKQNKANIMMISQNQQENIVLELFGYKIEKTLDY